MQIKAELWKFTWHVHISHGNSRCVSGSTDKSMTKALHTGIQVCVPTKSRVKDRSSLSVHLTSVSRSIRRQTTFHIKVPRNVTIGRRAYTRHAIKAIDYYLYVWKAEGIGRERPVAAASADARENCQYLTPARCYASKLSQRFRYFPITNIILISDSARFPTY